MSKRVYFNICKNLILSDLIILKRLFVNKFIDKSIWIFSTMFVTAYIMPYFGLVNNFGLFQFGGIITTVGLFELYASVVELVADFEGDRIIDYTLTLPIPSWLAIISKSIYYFILYFALTVSVLPLGKLLLWNQLDLTQINYLKLLLAIFFQSMFYACFVILVSSVINSMSKLGIVWSRFISPMWFLGGFQFSWIALYNGFPIFAWISLLNPMIYITESTRVALIGQADYLNFWLCLVVIFSLSVVCLAIGLNNLKKRLDFI